MPAQVGIPVTPEFEQSADHRVTGEGLPDVQEVGQTLCEFIDARVVLKVLIHADVAAHQRLTWRQCSAFLWKRSAQLWHSRQMSWSPSASKWDWQRAHRRMSGGAKTESDSRALAAAWFVLSVTVGALIEAVSYPPPLLST